MATYYIDFSQTFDGDGSTYTGAAGAGQPGAFNTIVGHLGASGDTFWIRRNQTKVVVAINFNVDNVKYIGWPISTDYYYASRPAGPQATWDADSVAGYAVMEHQANSGGTIFNYTGGNSMEFHRIYFKKSTANNSVAYTVGLTTAACLFRNCYWDSALAVNTVGSIVFQATTSTAVNQLSMYDCGFTVTGSTNQNYTCFSVGNANAKIYLNGCTIPASAITCTGITFVAQTPARTQYLYAENCSFTTTAAALNIPVSVANNTWRLHFYNCTFKSTTTLAISYANGGISNPQIITNNCLVTGGSGVSIGSASLGNVGGGWGDGSIWHFKQFTQDVAGTTGIAIYTQPESFYAENVTFKAGNTQDIYTYGGRITLRNALFASNIEVTSPTIKHVYCLDYNGNKGNWKSWVGNIICSTNASARTGGETYSIKIEPQSLADVTDQELGWVGIPGQELIYANCPAGTCTITIYGAYKLWSGGAPTQKDIWFDGSYYAGATGATVTAFSTRDLTGTALTSDASSWSGDSSLTVFKMTKTITVGQTSAVPIRVFLGKYNAGAYIYIDPKPVVS